jgi:hypothetical protein
LRDTQIKYKWKQFHVTFAFNDIEANVWILLCGIANFGLGKNDGENALLRKSDTKLIIIAPQRIAIVIATSR